MISVIVPVYNAESWLCDCIESILHQTYQDWELVIVDDGSTDNSACIGRRYEAADRRITFYSLSNGGVSRARNFGIDHSSGEYICFIDADDCYVPHALQILAEGIENNDADMAIGQFKFASTNNVNNVKDTFKADWKVVDSRRGLELTLYQHPHWHTGPWARIYKRSLFDNTRFVPDIRFEDLEIIPRLILKCRRIAVTSAVIYFYRKHSSNFITTESSGRKEALNAIDSFAKYIPAEWSECIAGVHARQFSAAFNLLGYAGRTNDDDTAELCWEIVRKYRLPMLSDPQVRRKNKLGALMSYLGFSFSKMLCSWIGK